MKITIYRKATHTDQYLDFRSNHHIKQKIGIISTFEHRIKELVTTEEDKKNELTHVKKALKRCGHPNRSLNRKKKNNQEKGEKVERRGKVVLPYVKKVSENIAKILKRHDIEAIHKPSATLKNLLCSKMKDKVEDYDKTGAVYHNECLKHKEPKNDYVGETDRGWRSREYEHRVVDYKTARTAASIDLSDDEKKKKVDSREKEKKQPTRKSSRTKKGINYKELNEGKKEPLSEGSTELSAHVASQGHEKSDLGHKIIWTDDN